MLQCFVVRTVTHGEPLPINEIIYQLHEVVRMAHNRSAGSVLPVGAFTTAHRDLAARTLNALLTGKCNCARNMCITVLQRT